MRSFFLLVSALFLSSPAAFATELSYVCDVTLVAPDLPDGVVEWRFQAPLRNGSHGGEPRIFRSGDYEVQVTADAQWLALRWFEKDRHVAEAVFALGTNDRTMYRVGLVYDTTRDGVQVSVGCMEGIL